MLTKEEIVEIFKKTNVLQEGHFKLTSGRHSGQYLQCAQVLQYPQYTTQLCSDIAEYFKNESIDVVVGPAMGGIVIAFEVARQMGVKSIFTERVDGKMTLRRGFAVKPGEKVLVVEDVVTTGGSVQEVIDLVRENEAEVIGVGLMVDRSNGKVQFGVPQCALLSMEVQSYEPEECPFCKQGLPIVKPGSRK